MLGGIHRTVLAARAAEGEHQTGEATLDVTTHMGIGQLIDTVQEGQYLTVIFEEVNDRLVQTRHGLIRVVPTRIMGGTAVEDVPASITGFISRKTAFKRE